MFFYDKSCRAGGGASGELVREKYFDTCRRCISTSPVVAVVSIRYEITRYSRMTSLGPENFVS